MAFPPTAIDTTAANRPGQSRRRSHSRDMAGSPLRDGGACPALRGCMRLTLSRSSHACPATTADGGFDSLAPCDWRLLGASLGVVPVVFADALQLLTSPVWLDVDPTGKLKIDTPLPRQATSLLHLKW